MKELLTLEDYNMDKISKLFKAMDIKSSTIKDYLYRIPLFYNFVKQNELHADTFIKYKRYLYDKNDLTASSKNKYLNVARILLKELARIGHIPDITLNVKSFRQEKKHKKQGLTLKEIKGILTYINNMEAGLQKYRLKALFSLLTYQGLRQIEIVRLNVTDLKLDSAIAYIQSKGQSDKELIYLHPATIKALKKYIRYGKIKSGALFFSFGNRKSKDNRICSITIKREFKNIFKELGINKTVHSARHFYITSLLQKMDARDVRKFSRHKSLEMLIVYDDELDVENKKEIAFSCFNAVNVT